MSGACCGKGYHYSDAGRLFLGTVGQSQYIINKIKAESGLKDIKVVATGGLGKMISDYTDEIDIYDRNLTLKGLQIIFDKQKK